MSDFTIALEKSCRSYAEQQARIVKFLRFMGFDYADIEGIFVLDLTEDEMGKMMERRGIKTVLQRLREPTEAMLQAGCASHPFSPYSTRTTLVEIIEAEWRAMVDEGLKCI